MTPEQLEQFKAAINAAVEAHLAKGGVIVQYHFGGEDDSGKGRCPIGCLILEDSPDKTVSEEVSAKMGFDVSPQETWDFIYGFDGHGRTRDRAPTFQFGQELREKYIP